MNKQQIKNTAKTVANVNAQKRRLTRKEAKEVVKVTSAFNKICNSFYDFLFYFDWDETTHIQYDDGTEVSVEELKPFQDFNSKWIAWCERWKADKNHNTPVNENAFHEWAIDNTK